MSAHSVSKDNELYHYTGKGGLLGITKNCDSNKQLWASHILFLNDRSEFNLAFEKTKSITAKLRMGHKLKYKPKVNLQRAINFLLDGNIEKEDAYIVSFSQEYDNLNMWKKYTDMSPGFCISFDAAMLSDENLKNDTIDCVSAVRVLYNKDEQNSFIEKVIKEAENDPSSTSDFTFSQNLYNRLIEIAPRIKHCSFSDEKEWRIIIKTKRKNVTLREGGTAFVPYYALNIDKKYFKHITIGPCENSDYVKQSVEFLCSRYFENTIGVKESKLPYRI